MAKLRPPGMGPRVGHTTTSSCRIWIRAGSDADAGPDSEHRTVGVIAVTRANGKRVRYIRPHYFRMRREFDRGGAIHLGQDTPGLTLEADTEYVARVGYLLLDDPYDDDTGVASDELIRRLPKPIAWLDDLLALDPGKARAVFRTFPEPPAGVVSFMMGSCRYPGLLWKKRHSDRIFRPMAELAKGGRAQDAADPEHVEHVVRPSFTLMMGDQIYADKLNRHIPLGRADTYDEFRQRYITAFNSPNFRELSRHNAVYCGLDDHEIEDDWSRNRLRGRGSYHLFTVAIDAFMNYQWSLGPRTWGKNLYYTFECGGYPFFMLDTRTQRWYDEQPGNLQGNHMLGRPTHQDAPPGQLQRLLDWLAEQQFERGNVPKFVVTPSVFVPNPMSERTILEDGNPEVLQRGNSWAAFPSTRSAILSRIVESRVQNVVFLSGDIHCCNVAEMHFTGGRAEDLRLFSVTSSAFYWPFPFADGEPSDFVHNSSADDQRDTFLFTLPDGEPMTMDYIARNFSQEDNFTLVTVDPDSSRIRVQVFDNRGNIVFPDDSKLDPFEPAQYLELGQW